MILVEEPKLTQVRLLVRKFADAFRFYKDVMGFGVRYGDEAGPYADFDARSILLALNSREIMADPLGLDVPSNAPSQDAVALVFAVVDVDSAVHQLERRGANFLTRPTDRPDWGIRTAHLRDPDGNLIELNQELQRQ